MSEKGVDPDSKIATQLGTKVLSISEVDYEATIPDGEYEGVWGGYTVRLKVGWRYYELKTEEGVRAMAAPCIVTVKNSVATVRAK